MTDRLHGLEATIGAPDPDAPRQGTNLSYIPALDGIRGVAIIVIMGSTAGSS